MPNRILRDELLTSERYWSASPEARNLFTSIVLSVDDTARFTASNFALRTRCMAGTVSPERIERLLLELVDLDMVRLYEADGGRYLFLPRFRQSIRYVNSRYPAPPEALVDIAPETLRIAETRKEKRNEIKELIQKKLRLSNTQAVPELVEVKRREVNLYGRSPKKPATEPYEFHQFYAAYPRKVKRQDAFRAWQKIHPDSVLTMLIMTALERQKQSGEWLKSGGQFIPYPASWLNAHRWEDEPITIKERFPL